MIRLSGRDPKHVSAIDRYLREAQMLTNEPAGRKGVSHPPTIETVHAAVLLVACMAEGPRLHVVEQVKAYWHASLYKPEIDAGRTFGPDLTTVFEAAVGRLAVRHTGAMFTQTLKGVSITPGLSARIQQIGRDFTYRIADRDLDDGLGIGSIHYAQPFLIEGLAEVVWASRHQAEKLGVTIDTDTAWRALECPSNAKTAASLAGETTAVAVQNHDVIPAAEPLEAKRESSATQPSRRGSGRSQNPTRRIPK